MFAIIQHSIFFSSYWKMDRKAILIAAVYAVYLCLAIVALTFAAREEHKIFVLLVPSITNTLHFVFLLAGFVVVKSYSPYPVAPISLYLATDLILAAATGASFYAYLTDSEKHYFVLGGLASVMTILASLLCFRKAYLLNAA